MSYTKDFTCAVFNEDFFALLLNVVSSLTDMSVQKVLEKTLVTPILDLTVSHF